MESLEGVRSRSAYGAASQLEDWIDRLQEDWFEETGDEEEYLIRWVIQAMTYAMNELRARGSFWDDRSRERVAEAYRLNREK